MLRIMAGEMAEYRDQVLGYYQDVHRIVSQLERACRQYQTFQLSHDCMMPVDCADVTALKRWRSSLPPWEVFLYLRGYGKSLLRRQ